MVGTGSDVEVTVRRISEPLQTDEKLMSELRRAGVVPRGSVHVRHDGARLVAGSAGETVELTPDTASHVFVSA